MSNKKIAKNALLLFGRLILTTFFSLFASRFVFQSLGISDFGLYSIVGSMVLVVSFLNTVMSSTTYSFLAVEIGKGKSGNPNFVFNISLVLHICIVIFTIVFAESFGVYYIKNFLSVPSDKISDSLFILRFSTATAVVSIISVPFQGLLIAEEKFLNQTIIEIIRSALSLIVAIVLSHYVGNKLRFYTFWISVVNIIPSIILFVYCRLKYYEIIKWKFYSFLSSYTSMISHMGWTLFGSLGWVGQREGSSILINTFFGNKISASFGIANQVNAMAMMLAKNLGQAAVPQIIKSLSFTSSTTRTDKLVAYTTKYSSFLMLFPSIPLLLETEQLLTYWLGSVPSYTVIICRLIIINSFFDTMSSSAIPSVIMASGKIKPFMLFAGLISFMGVPIVYFIFRNGGEPYFAIVVFILTTVTNLILNQILLKRILNYNVYFFINKAFLRVLLVVVFIFPLFFIKELFQPSIFRVLFLFLTSSLWLLIIVFFIGMEKSEKSVLFNYIKKKINK
jgi:O-antigen/teichoic acid export membrane protein